MNCSDAQDYLSAYLDRQLSAELRDRVAEHVEACPRCREEVRTFGSLCQMAKKLPTPDPPKHIWDNVQRELADEPAVAIVTPPERGRWTNFQLLSVAATLLLALLGIFAVLRITYRGQHNEMAANLDRFMEEFARNPDEAQQVLLTSYDGKALLPEELVQTVKHDSVALREAPGGFTKHAVYLLTMPCCKCTQTVYRRDSGGYVTVFEHDTDKPESSMWFGDRPCVCVQCNGKSCDLIQVDEQLAVTCQLKSGPVTVFGARDVEEVTSLVAWLDGEGPVEATRL